ncbi:MAG: hypothetical protein IPM56_01215 [Ignavibacteriales bacterium]|nr:MAG: hypothetical protein IPM56_01215 [Ignavibacteriales bacterium]
MKTKILFTVLFLFSVINIFSQGIPGTINYQGVLKDNSGVVVPDGDYNITFRIYLVSAGGVEVWSETKSVPVYGGVFSTVLGSVNPINIDFNVQLYVGISIASDPELTPRIQLTSVPYSLISKTVPDNSLTANKINSGEVVKSVNGLKDNVNIVAGTNVTITPVGNNITISSTGTGGGGTITGVSAGTGLFGGGTSGNVTLSVQASGITNTLLANNSVTSNKIVDGTLVAADISTNQLVKSFNGLKDSVTLVAGSNISITPSGNNLTISSTGSGSSVWSTNGTNAFYNTGNVGIGLNTPQNLLQLHRTDPLFGSPSVLRLTNFTSGATSNDGMILSLNNTVADFGLIGVLMMQENNSLAFGTNNTYQMFLKETGLLGLGTFNPQAKFDIFHNSQGTSPQLMISENENGGFGRISFRSEGVDGKYWTIASRSQATDASSQFNIYYFNGTSGQDVVSVNGNGNVGIGTTAPAQKLDVAGNIRTTGEINRSTTGNANLLPICYGNVSTVGAINTGTGNFSVTRTSAGNYDITITGEDFVLSNYIVNVNAVGSGTAVFSSVDGKLLIRTYDILVSGLVSADKTFAFTVYKP